MTRKELLLVEDQPRQAEALKRVLIPAGWNIKHVVDKTSALEALRNVQSAGQLYSVVAFDLGLPPGPDDPFLAGIPLARNLRALSSTLPLVAYTALSSKAFAYEQALKVLLPRKITFLYLRQLDDDELVKVLDLVWRGACIFSRAPADYLPRAISERPDPLDEGRDWQILKLINENRTLAEIAGEVEGLSTDGVRARVRRIKDALIDAGWLQQHEDQLDDLKSWYRDHHVRFSRG